MFWRLKGLLRDGKFWRIDSSEIDFNWDDDFLRLFFNYTMKPVKAQRKKRYKLEACLELWILAQ